MKISKKSLGSMFKIRTLMYFSIPIILMSVIIIINHQMNIRNYNKLYQNFYFNYFDEIFKNNDMDIQYAINMSNWLADDNFRNVFTAETSPSDLDSARVLRRMNDMKNDIEFVESMVMINKKADFALGTNGKASIDKYFDVMCVYSDYDDTFWENYRYPIGSIIQLPPTEMSNGDNQVKYVMPIVFSSIGDIASNNLFIMNIDLSKIVEKNTRNNFTPNTLIYFVNKKTKKMYSGINSSIDLFDDESEIWRKLVEEDYISIEYTDGNNNEYLVLSHTASPNLMDYAYVILVPLEDICSMVNSSTARIVAVTLIMFVLLTALSLFFANKLHTPFNNIISALGANEGTKVASIAQSAREIENAIIRLSEENRKIKKDISRASKSAKERRIIDLLNNKQVNNHELRMFANNNFMAVLVRIKHINIISQQYREYHIFCGEIYDMIKQYFSDKYDIYILPTVDESLFMLMNLEDDIDEETVINELDNIKNIVKQNDKNIEIEIADGGIHYGIEGLKETYDNVNQKITGFIVDDIPDLEIQNIVTENIYYKLSDENVIINNMLAGNYDKARDHIEKIMVNNVTHGVSSDNMKRLYVNIVHAIFMSFSIKGIDTCKLFGGNSEAVMYEKIMRMTESQICAFILDVLELLERSTYYDDGGIWIEDVMDYIKDNYTDSSLCLDSISEHFGTNAKYISKLFSKKSKVQFHDYLAGLRIDKAKSMLENTDMKIEEIYNAVGYQSRTTFIRVFKANVGVTPTEYRNNIKQ